MTNEVQARETVPPLGSTVRAISGIWSFMALYWRTYRDERYLRDQPPHRLTDIGITRAEIDAKLRGRPYY
jgi:uncharacterized protein YjiS (DUF1127 family)